MESRRGERKEVLKHYLCVSVFYGSPVCALGVGCRDGRTPAVTNDGECGDGFDIAIGMDGSRGWTTMAVGRRASVGAATPHRTTVEYVGPPTSGSSSSN